MKSVLVMEKTPMECSECRLQYDNMECMAVEDGKEFRTPVSGRPSWCPLKPMPKKKDENSGPARYSHYAYGWNDCIEQIEGDNDD